MHVDFLPGTRRFRLADEAHPNVQAPVAAITNKHDFRQARASGRAKARFQVQPFALSQVVLTDETGAVAADIAHLDLRDLLPAIYPSGNATWPAPPAAPLLGG